jgi:hypothetical protein
MKKIRLTKMRTAIASVVGLCIFFLPAIPTLLRESHLAQILRQQCKDSQVAKLSDAEIRGKMQSLARKEGVHLALENIFVQYESDKDQSIEQTVKRIGYTLPIELPFAGVFNYSVVSVRIFDVTPNL